MNIYFLNVAMVIGGAMVFASSQKLYFNRQRIDIGLKLFLALLCFLLFFEMAFRGDFSTDIKNYYYIFKSSSDNLADLFRRKDFLAGRDIFYQILNTLVRQLGGTFLQLQMIIAAIISFSYVKFVKNNSPIFWLSFLILFCSGSFYTGFNVTRQLLVAALFSLCYRFIEKKQLGKYLISVLLISGIHQSALLMIPVYFFAHIQWKKKSSFAVVGIVVILSFASYSFADTIVSVITKFIFTRYSDEAHFGVSEGVGILGTFKAIAMASGILLNYKKFNMENPKERLVYNGTALYFIFAVVGSNIFIIQRFTHFFVPCLMIGYPILLTKVQKAKNRQLASFVIACFFIAAGLNVMLDGNYYFYWNNKASLW